MILAILKYCRKANYVLIDTYSTSNFWFAFVTSQMCRMLRLRYLPVLHGGNLPARLKKNPRLCKMVFKNAYRNITPSKYLLEAFKDRGYAELVYIPNPIEIKNYPFRLRNKINPSLLWVRTLASIITPKWPWRYYPKLKKHFPGARLCMVGPDSNGKLQELQALARKLDLEVNFTGKLPKPEWVQLSEEFDIFINTTHADNLPVSVLEAMALGLAVVSTNVGGIPYLLEDHQTALLVADNDVSAMTVSIRNLVDQPVMAKKMALNAKALADTFDWDFVRGKWRQILI